MIPDTAIIKSLSAQFAIIKPVPENFMKNLSDVVNHLLQHDFLKLVQILYRLDISESKLKGMLAENPTEDAGLIIAQLVVQREQEKILSRRQYKSNDEIPEDERW